MSVEHHDQSIVARSGAVRPTRDHIRATVAALLDEPVDLIGDDDDLVVLGLDSMGIMTLANTWRGAGMAVTFAELVEHPTITGWHGRLDGPTAPPTPLVSPLVALDVPHDLAPMQLAYWVGRQDGMPLGAVGSHFYFEFDGFDVDADRLDVAVRALTRRHPMLRARFAEDGTQRVDPEPRGLGGVHDLSAHPPEEAARLLAELRDRLSHQRLDVTGGQVVDVRLSLLPAGRTRVHVDIDMLVCDALSFRIAIADLAELYRDPRPAEAEADYSYPQYLADRRASRAGTDAVPGPRRAGAERDAGYWRDRLDSLPGAPLLPLATPPELLSTARTVRRHHWLAPADADALGARARAQGLTLSMVLATAYAEIVAAWSADQRFLLNLPVFDRVADHPAVDGLVGDFTNLVLLEVDARAGVSFADRARAVQDRFRADAAHSGYPGTEVLRDLAKARPDTPTSAPVVFTSALSMGELFAGGVRQAFGDPVWMSSQTAGVWLDLQVVEHDAGLLLNWESVDALFHDGVPAAMFAAFVDLVDRLGDPATDWHDEVATPLPAAQARTRAAVNDTTSPVPHGLLHQRFFELAHSMPDAVGVVWGEDGELTYGELALRALRLAGLLRSLGVSEAEPVAVSLPKGPDQVVAVLGVLAAGCTYVPAGLDQPMGRRHRIYDGSGSRFVVTCATAEVVCSLQVIDIADVLTAPALDCPVPVPPDRIAYTIYTSGSTGDPKGVQVSHRAALNTVAALNERFGVGPGDRTLALSSLDFDLSVYDLFGPLCAGGAVICVTESERRDAHRWTELITRRGATVLNCVPALLDMLLVATEDANTPFPLRLLLLGGDWIGLDLPGRVARRNPDCRFVALGGTTEASIHSTVCEVGDVPPHWRSVPYGVPLPNQRCRVVDSRGGDCPDWVPGELWIGGVGVAAGYAGDLARTADRFVRHGDERWYRTGDLARYWPDGVLEFLGRADFQVKVNGHRIELGEIETALRDHPAVLGAVTTTVGDRSPRLAAMVAVRTDTTDVAVDAEWVREFLRQRLPEYMVPDRLRLVDALPMSANGKVDRKAVLAALRDPDADRAVDFEEPEGEVETRLAALWSDLLDVPRIGRRDSFFALGGDSLRATRLLTGLGSAGLLGARLGDLFATPVLRDFAATLRKGEPVGRVVLAADVAARHEPFPATEVQRAYWLGRRPEFTLGGVGSYWYWEFDGEGVDLDRLEDAWNRLVLRHEMMRGVFDADGNQRVLPEVPRVRLHVTEAGPGEDDRCLAELRATMSHRVFDVERWPLFDVRAVRYGADRTRIAFGFDYIVLDALSIMIIFWELSALYRDPGTVLPTVDVSFRDYVLGVHPDPDVRAADERYWLDQVRTLPRAPQLPLAIDPALLAAPRFTRRQFSLPEPAWQGLTRRAAQHGLTPSTVLATAFAEVLATWSATPEIALNLTLFDRREVHPDINNILGDFTSLMLVGHHARADRSWAASARELQRQVWTGLQHSTVSAVWVLRELAKRAGPAELLMPVVFTSTLGVSDKLAELDIPFGRQVHGLSQTPQVSLDCQVVEHNGVLTINWDVVADLFPENMVDAMFGAYERLVNWLSLADWTAPAPALLPADQVRTREIVNATGVPESGMLLHEAFFARAGERPEAVALLHGRGGSRTYGRLADDALRVAALLVDNGVRPGDAVAVCLPKGPDQIVAVLAVLAAGGVYVPVGADQPAVRRDRILLAAGAAVVITEPTPSTSDLPATVRVLDIGAADTLVALPAPVRVPPERLAYVIFTSGSTGEPKGVEISHRAAVNTVEDVNERFGVEADDRVLAVSALDFDLSVYDIFGLLSVGGSVVLIDEDARREARDWAELVAEHGVTVWNTVPALLDMLVVAGGADLPPRSLRLAMVSGDWVGLDLPGRLAAAAPRCRLVALGGATEVSIWSNSFEVDEVLPEWRSVPYGFPLRNQRYRVVDPRGGDCPDWVSGELWIGGVGVADGYRGDPERTAERFVSDRGVRWYRTGDLGRYQPGGLLEFLGRVDQQVKVRGHRIELGEVEAALRAHPEVSAAVAGAVGERTARRLVAWVTGDTGGPDDTGLRAFLADRLPAYMVPGQVLHVDSFPLSPNGKVDRAALTTVSGPEADSAEPPRPGIEREVAELWDRLLDLPGVRRADSFFTVGGDSLSATGLVEMVRDRFGLRLSLRQLFSAPTLAEFAALVERERAARRSSEGGFIEEGVL